MSLVSPRFPSSRLRTVASGGTALRKGDSGRSIHLIQHALLDLGHAMPRSTRRASYSPDGIYGNETVAKVKEFQAKNRLAQSGEVNRHTMRALDTKLKGYQHRVRLHFRSIAMQNVPFQQSMRDALIIFGQYGIKIEFGSGSSLQLTPAQAQVFDKIDGQCVWKITAGEYNQLHGIGRPAPSTEILVYYVKRFANANLLGCGGHAANRPAATVAAASSRWVTSHEVGHVLLTSAFAPVHINDRRNLMFPQDVTHSTIPVLTNMQVTQIRKSPCCKPS